MYMGRTPTLDLTGLLLLPLRNYFSTLPVTKKQTEKRNLPVVGDALLISARPISRHYAGHRYTLAPCPYRDHASMRPTNDSLAHGPPVSAAC